MSLAERIDLFHRKRDWKKYHTPGELARAISIEAGELQELFLWGNDPHFYQIRSEMADIYIYLLTMAGAYGFDLEELAHQKMDVNEGREVGEGGRFK